MILIIGGAGYIGSHIVKELISQQHRIVVLDDLSTGHRVSVNKRAIFEKGDFRNPDDLDRVFSRYSIEAVMHVAAYDAIGMRLLLKKMLMHQVYNFIFSSELPFSSMSYKDQIKEVYTPYPFIFQGNSSLVIEQMLEDFYKAYDLHYISLRYYNAVGANIEEGIGEDHQQETHLLPRILLHLRDQEKQPFLVNRSYATEDGTFVREYLHVMDVARAHVGALHSLLQHDKTNERYNISNEIGCSVRELIEKCEIITGKKMNISYNSSSSTDLSIVVSSANKIYRELGWKALCSIDEAIHSAWLWHKRFPSGYKHRELVYK
ncbi:UDP-glucose 4-epimerase [Bacillus rhizoplanae]|uniref:UDP-glucose 4-epimerase n=1 Tax=Bacillus rhizoplanae TaxID=2880966 RepID=A0ABN7ZY59_9BACI|nr:NAD-dependent epimerase/dehydratase family protein [Bacillus rhizoplanae]CAG9612128.1 UDP-glucose 4-epimerase [Bacillus rhizoplanae]